MQNLGYTGLSGALSGLTYNYTYNALGNIASVAKGSGTATTYTYDSMGQLTGANLPGLTCAYTYDGAGNLLTASNGTTTNTYTYGDASWKDLLTAFNGEKIVYEGQTLDGDGNGNGCTYRLGSHLGPLRHFLFYYSELTRTDAEGNVTVLYRVSKVKNLLILNGILAFVLICGLCVFLQVRKSIINGRKQREMKE